MDWPLCGKKRVGKISSHNRCLFGKISSDPISYLISTDIMWLVREAVCKGLITRSQLNEGFMYRMEMSSSSHLRALSPFYSVLFPTEYNKYSCGQILYAFLLRPDTLPRSYTTWYTSLLKAEGLILTFGRIGQAAKVPKESVTINHDLVRNGILNINDLDRLVLRRVSRPIYTPSAQHPISIFFRI